MNIPVRKIPTVPKRTISSTQIAKPQAATAPKKTFKTGSSKSENEGESIIIYADTGMGKTTLASTSPDPVFISIDKGGRVRIKNPITGADLTVVEGVETYADVREVLRQYDLFESHKSVVIDTITILEDLAIPYMLENITMEKGAYAKNIISYGYNKGYRHLYDLMKSILQDCDALIRRGKNVILLAQSAPNKVSNPGGEEYLREGPRLYAGTPSVESMVCEWCDHIFRIDYKDIWVKDRKASGDSTRVIYTKPEVYFRAKSLIVNEPVISFSEPADDSLWKFMFPEVK